MTNALATPGSRNGSYIALAQEEYKKAQEMSKPRIQWRLSAGESRELDLRRTLSESTAAFMKSRTRTAMSFDIGRMQTASTKCESRLAEVSYTKSLWNDFRRGRWTIIPEPRRKGRVFHWTDVWDILVWIATLFTVFYVPFDAVMFKHEGNHGRTVHNTLLIIFTLDMFFTFVLAYKISSDNVGARYTQLWEMDPYMIAWRYVKPVPQGGFKSGWFLCDFFCVAPGWLEFVLRYSFEGFENPRLEAASRLCLVARFIAPLIRPFLKSKTSRWDRLLERAHQEYGRSIVGGGRLANFVTTSAVICHFMACGWLAIEGNILNGLVSYSTPKKSWLAKLVEMKGDPCTPDMQTDHICVYTLALYWSWTTLSSVGYGDITPMNNAEYVCCTITIIISYFLSAYVIGSFASLLSAFMDPHSVVLEHDMQLLDNMMDARGISKPLKSRIRGYMYRSQGVMTMRAQASFLENQKLSHGLQREVAQETLKNTELWAPVWWAAHLGDDILLEMTRFLYPEFYGPQEDVFANGQFMIILRSGCAAFKGHVLLRGNSWGHESVLLTSPGLIDRTPLKILSYADALQLKKVDIQYICHYSSDADRWFRRVQIKTAVRRAFVISASLIRQGKTLEAARSNILDLEMSHFSVEHMTPTVMSQSKSLKSDPSCITSSISKQSSFCGAINSSCPSKAKSSPDGFATGRADRAVHNHVKTWQHNLGNTLRKVLQQQEDMAYQLARLQEAQERRTGSYV